VGKCYNSVTLNASIGQAWDTIKDFHDMSWASDVITKVEKVGDAGGSTPGAKRILNDVFHETLLSIDEEQSIFTYSIDDGPGPVSKDSVQNYVGKVKVHPVTNDNTTFVEWTSTYESPDEQAVGDFCNPIYHALLSALKIHF
jgi:hypothetical protein